MKRCNPKVFLLVLMVASFLYRLYPRLLVYRWMACEEEYIYADVYDLVNYGSTRHPFFYPPLTSYSVYGLWLLMKIDPILLAQLFNPLVGALILIPYFLVVRKNFDEKTALLSCLFFAFSEAAFYRMSHFASTEVVSLLLSLTALLAFMSNSAKGYVASASLFVIAFCGHILPPIFGILAIFIDRFLYGTGRGRVFITIVTASTVLITFSPLIPYRSALFVMNLQSIISSVDLGNIFNLYDLTDLAQFIRLFFGTMLLAVAFLLFVYRTRKVNRYFLSIFLSAFLLFMASWLLFSPYITSPVRLMMYISLSIIPFASSLILKTKKLEVPAYILLFMIVSAAVSLNDVLWVNDSLTESEYKALDDPQFPRIEKPCRWWSDYPSSIAINLRVERGFVPSPLNVTEAQTQADLIVNFPQNVSTNDFDYVYLSKRTQTKGMFLEPQGKRNLPIHMQVEDVWRDLENWRLVYDKYGVKVYERVE